jgi:transcriptional regulator with XRE-family HTH domain
MPCGFSSYRENILMMGKKPIERGPVAERVSANVHRLRKRHNMSLADLSKRLDELGRSININGLHGIERGQRRVDVDDLIALALALRVTPNDLLLPDVRESGDAEISLTSKVVAANARTAWTWATMAEVDLPTGLGLIVDNGRARILSSTTSYEPVDGGDDA